MAMVGGWSELLGSLCRGNAMFMSSRAVRAMSSLALVVGVLLLLSSLAQAGKPKAITIPNYQGIYPNNGYSSYPNYGSSSYPNYAGSPNYGYGGSPNYSGYPNYAYGNSSVGNYPGYPTSNYGGYPSYSG